MVGVTVVAESLAAGPARLNGHSGQQTHSQSQSQSLAAGTVIERVVAEQVTVTVTVTGGGDCDREGGG